MSETNQHLAESGLAWRRHLLPGLAVLGLVLLIGLLASGCARPAMETPAQVSRAELETSLRQIAAEYAQDQDLARAQARLKALDLANPAQLLVTLAEQGISEGRPREEIAALARLATALGARSPVVANFLEPKPTATAVPPSPTAPPPSPTLQPSPTAPPPPATSSPTATGQVVTPTPAPRPRVLAEATVNLRSGPGRAYPVIGRLSPGQTAEIMARNASGDWWQVAWSGQGPAWVAGTTVKLQGPLDTVAVAQNIPPPPPTATPGPPTAPPPPTATPVPAGPDFRVVSRRLLTIEENGGGHDGPTPLCGNNHTLYITVLDAAGSPLNGVTIRDANGSTEHVSGDKGPGKLDFDLWWPGIDVVVVRDADGRQVTSEVARDIKVDTTAIPDDVLIGARYCTDAASCAHIKSECGCCHHLSWEVVFQRAY